MVINKEKLPQIGNPILRKKSVTVKKIELSDRIIKKIIKDIVDTMRAADLVGMAAPQLGKLVRIIAVEVRQTKYRKMSEEPLLVMINPRITWTSKSFIVDYEGCGSVCRGNIFGPVKRHKSIKVEYMDVTGKKCNIGATGNKAIIIQHESDHLDGILFTDRVTDNTKFIDIDSYLKMRVEQRKKIKK